MTSGILRFTLPFQETLFIQKAKPLQHCFVLVLDMEHFLPKGTTGCLFFFPLANSSMLSRISPVNVWIHFSYRHTVKCLRSHLTSNGTKGLMAKPTFTVCQYHNTTYEHLQIYPIFSFYVFCASGLFHGYIFGLSTVLLAVSCPLCLVDLSSAGEVWQCSLVGAASDYHQPWRRTRSRGGCAACPGCVHTEVRDFA